MRHISTLNLNTLVRCPTDRGDLPFDGVVTWIGKDVQTNSLGCKYVHIEVRDPWKRKALWPSNRLGFKVD